MRSKSVLDPFARFFNRVRLHPNTVTTLGLVGNTAGAYFLSQGGMTTGGLIVLTMGPVNALDGAMVRLRGKLTNFGAFIDSITDCYSVLVIFFKLLLHFAHLGDWLTLATVFTAAAGSDLVSYMHAGNQSRGIL